MPESKNLSLQNSVCVVTNFGMECFNSVSQRSVRIKPGGKGYLASLIECIITLFKMSYYTLGSNK
jgi:hypothetical protein